MTIELEQARKLLKQAMETQGPDFVYNPKGLGECLYEQRQNSEGPQAITGCLIGVALDLSGETRHHGFRGNVMTLRSRYPDMMSADAVLYFYSAQLTQDNGSTWGEAYLAAEKWYRSQ